MLRKRTNRIGILAVKGAISKKDVETAFNKSSSSKSSSSSKDDGVASATIASATIASAPVNWNADLGIYGLTSIKNRRTLVDVITHDVPSPTKGIFNKLLIDYLLYYKLLDNKTELIKYLSGITIIFLKDIELTPIVIKLLKLATKYSSNIDTLILRNIKLPNEDKEAIIDGLIRMIRKMTNIEILDFSGFSICNIYKNCPSRAHIGHTTRYKFAKLFNNLIVKLVNLKKLNFIDNIMDKEEYCKIFEEHTTNNKHFEYWEDENEEDTDVRIYDKDGKYRTIYVNAFPNLFVDAVKDELYRIPTNVNDNVKNMIEEDFIQKFAIKGGRALRKRKPVKPTNKK